MAPASVNHPPFAPPAPSVLESQARTADLRVCCAVLRCALLCCAAMWHAVLWHATPCRRLHRIDRSGGMRASWHSEALLPSSHPASLWHGVRTCMLAVQCVTAGGWVIHSCGSSFACWTTPTRSVQACHCINLGTLQRRATVEQYSSLKCHRPLSIWRTAI